MGLEMNSIFFSPTISEYLELKKMPLSERKIGIMDSHLKNLCKIFLVHFPDMIKLITLMNKHHMLFLDRFLFSKMNSKLPEAGGWGNGQNW